MLSERMQRRLNALLDEADVAVSANDWALVADKARAALALDATNEDATAFLRMAEANRGAANASFEATPPPPPTPAPAQPTSFVGGRYEVKRFLGEGGKKRVYLAHDSLLDRDVAFALIKTEGLDEVGRARIQREAQTMGRLGAHPHIVSVFDLGQEGEQPYIVTELMGGGDVEGLIERAEDHRLPISEVLRLADEVCQGLAFAHQHDVVHRDLKPGNVWLTADGRAKVGDFGLAVALDRSRMTQAGMMVGTASYMPPEQALGGMVTAKSDLYSLGAMLYEAVTGRPPFLGDEAVAVISQHLNTAPVAPSWHRPDCPPGLEALLLRLLEKDPEQRPASAEEVRTAVLALAQATTSEWTAPAPHEEAAAQALYQRTFVGREAELAQLTNAFDRALSGEGAVAMVVGEPGIGKTTLTEQLATYATLRGGRALWGHCYEEGSLALPYLAFVEALRGYVLERDGDALRSELGSGAGEVARIVSEVRDRVQVSPAEAGEPEEQRYRLMTAVTTFLRNASAVQPLLVVLEDLHDADRGTLDLLLHLARNLQGARLLVVGTYRDVEVDRAHPLSATLAELRRVHAFLRVPLRGLSPEEVHRMMSNVRGQEVSRSRAEAVWRQTEGNPLFVQEVLRYLVEAGLVVREGDRYVRTDGGPDEAGIPEGLREVIGKRLTRLSPETNAILAVAAVQGRDFRLDVLQAVANQPAETVEAALEEAAERAIVEARTGLGTLAFRFTHAFFRQTLYEELFAARRLRLHQQVGRALEEAYGRRAEDHAAELAEHFAQSTDPADLERALHYAEVAAERALAVYAYGDAARELDRALKLLHEIAPEDDKRRLDLLLFFGRVLLPAGEARRALDEAANPALALAERLGDSLTCGQIALFARAALNQWGAAAVMRTAEAGRWRDAADKFSPPGTYERVQTDFWLATQAGADNKFKDGIALRRRATETAELIGTNQARWYAAQWMTGVLGAPCEIAQQLALARAIPLWSTDGVPPREVHDAYAQCVFSLMAAGERDAAEALLARASTIESRIRDASLQFGLANGFSMVLMVADGRLEDAVSEGEALIRLGDELGYPIAARQIVAGMTSPARLLLGDASGALDLADELLRVSDAQTTRARRAEALATAGRGTEAAEALGALRDEVDPAVQSDAIFTRTLLAMLNAAVQIADRETAALLIPALEPAKETWHDQGSPPRLLGDALALLRRPNDARDCLLVALSLATRVRYRPEVALSRLGLAEVLLAHYSEERADALEHLDFAIEEFRAMKMQPALERALRHRELLKA